MSLLDDARRIAHWPTPLTCAESCWFCGGGVGEHDSGCLRLSMPKIVKALEAAERLAACPPVVAAGKLDTQDVCAVCWAAGDHADDCSWQALVAALKGEEAE